MTDTNPTHTQNPPSEPTPANPPRERNREDREDGKPRLDPVRYGDWEKNGRCIDF
jgi:hypothetical protein